MSIIIHGTCDTCGQPVKKASPHRVEFVPIQTGAALAALPVDCGFDLKPCGHHGSFTVTAIGASVAS